MIALEKYVKNWWVVVAAMVIIVVAEVCIGDSIDYPP